MANVRLSIAALCHAKNLPELETWFRDIIILEWEHGKLDKYVGILKIEKNALIMEDPVSYTHLTLPTIYSV